MQLPGGEITKLRLNFFDAPEALGNVRYQPYNEESTKALTDLIKEKKVTVKFNEDSSYRRPIAEIFVDEKPIANYMIENGYATWYSRFDDLSSEEAKERQQLEEKAKAEGKGIWSVENINKYQQPEKFRYRHENEIKQGYVYAFSNMKQEDGEAAAKKDDHSYMTYQANRDGYKYEIVEEGIEDEYNYYIKAKKIK